jgi:GTP cyclohydrolase II
MTRSATLGRLRPPAVARAAAPVDPARLRAVHRAVSELRRGTPVLLEGDPPLAVLAVETVGPRGIGELTALSAEPAVMLLAPARAAVVLGRRASPRVQAVAIQMPADGLEDMEVLRCLADPTLDQPVRNLPLEAPLPGLARAALALAKLGRLLPAVLAAPARADAAEVAERLGLLHVSAADVLAYPSASAVTLRRVAEAQVPMDRAADARVIAFRTEDGAIEHLAIVIGQPRNLPAPLVRLHSECFTGDLLGSLRCDCGSQLRGAIGRIAEDGAGVVLYLAQEGRGIGLVNKLRAYALQDRGLDTLDANRALGWGADERSFLTAATMLESLGIKRVRLLTNNPGKLAALAACGVEIVGREAHAFAPNGVNDQYLATKAERFGHLLGE